MISTLRKRGLDNDGQSLQPYGAQITKRARVETLQIRSNGTHMETVTKVMTTEPAKRGFEKYGNEDVAEITQNVGKRVRSDPGPTTPDTRSTLQQLTEMAPTVGNEDMMDIVDEKQTRSTEFSANVPTFTYMKMHRDIRARAMADTLQRVCEILNVVRSSFTEESCNEGLYLVLQSLRAFCHAAENNPFCWHLTAAEQEDFRKVVAEIVTIFTAVSRYWTLRFSFPMFNLMKEVNGLFCSLLGMDHFLDDVLRHAEWQRM